MDKPENDETPQNAGCNPRLVRWRASGICMVPNEVEIFVWATSEAGAKRIAKARFKSAPREHIVGNSEDETSAWDFRPEVEICPQNAPGELPQGRAGHG